MEKPEIFTFELPEKQLWQAKLDPLVIGKEISAIKGQIENLVIEEIQARFSSLSFNKYHLTLFLDSINAYIHSKNKAWPKDYLKIKCRTKHGAVKIILIYHDYTYRYNIFHKEVIFSDNGNDIFTYSSDWVKANIGDEHSICVYALAWMKKNGKNIIEEGYEIRKIG